MGAKLSFATNYISKMKRFPVIDYSSHPAFAHLPQYTDSISEALLKAFTEINVRMDEFDAKTEVYVLPQIESFYQNTIAPFVGNTITPLINAYEGNTESRELMINALGTFIQKLIDQSVYFNLKKQFTVKLSTANARKVYDELTENGITLSAITEKEIEQYNKGISAYKNEIKRQSDEDPLGRKAMGLPRRSSHWGIIEKNMVQSGFIEGASAFYGSHLVVTGCGLEYSSDRQRWWQNCYEDIGLPTSKCVYMHNDYDYDYVKSLVYLNRVETIEGGPFCYIPESHKWQREKSLSFYIKDLEIQLAAAARKKGVGKKAYYRPAMSSVEGRTLFIAFPKLFRQLSHFGDDVLDESELSRELLSKEMAVTSDKGNFCFFTGGSGIHRGGTVYKGDRWALQITLTKEPALTKKISSFARNTTGSVLAAILGEDKMLQIHKKYHTVI